MTNNKNIQMIVDKLKSMKEDTTLQERLKTYPDKEEEMYSYVSGKAREQALNGCAIIEDSVVYAWAREFYIDYGVINKKSIEKEEKAKEAEKIVREQKKKQIETLMETKKGVAENKKVEKKESKQVSIFDFEF